MRHAMLVLQQLQGTLDFEKGGQVARHFERFYNLVRAKLLESQLRNSPELMQQQIRFMSEVRDCWAEAEKRLKPKPAPTAANRLPRRPGFPTATPLWRESLVRRRTRHRLNRPLPDNKF